MRFFIGCVFSFLIILVVFFFGLCMNFSSEESQKKKSVHPYRNIVLPLTLAKQLRYAPPFLL